MVQGTGRVAEKGMQSWWGDGMTGPEAHRRGRQQDEAAGPSPSQYEEKDKAFKEQLSHLATLLPTLQVRSAGGMGLGAPAQRAPSSGQALSSVPPAGSPGHLLLLPQLGQQGGVLGPGLCESPQLLRGLPLSPLGLAACHLDGGPGDLWAYRLPVLHTIICKPFRDPLSTF